MMRTRIAVVVMAVVMLTPLSGTGWAADEADPRASCMGIISSRVDPGHRAYLAHLTKSTTAPTLGFTSPGGYTSYFAQFHGSEIGPECS